LIKVLDELKLQINPTDEILVVDDWSPDGLPEIDCPCTKVIRPEKHIPHIYRLCTLRNLGLQSASHDCVVVLDPDCVPNPHFVENARKIFDPSILFGGAIDFIQEDGSIMPDPRQGETRRSKWVDLDERYWSGVMIWGGCMMFSRSRTALTGWFDEEFNGGWGAEEHEFASRCFHGGLRLYYSIELAVTHLYHPKKTFNYDRNLRLWREKISAKSGRS